MWRSNVYGYPGSKAGGGGNWEIWIGMNTLLIDTKKESSQLTPLFATPLTMQEP